MLDVYIEEFHILMRINISILIPILQNELRQSENKKKHSDNLVRV